jgi:hypothetical protein
MLKMKCPQCEEMIVSPLLSDLDQIPCEHCKEIVPVADDVLVFAEGFTFHRNDLIKRVFRYKTLLDEICKERELLEKNPDASEESKKSLARFAEALAEVMAGARRNFRIDFTQQVPLRYRINSQQQTGLLNNLSMSGACVQIERRTACPRKKTALAVAFRLPGVDHSFTLTGSVSWVKKGTSFGVEFDKLPQRDADTLWDFITAAVDA